MGSSNEWMSEQELSDLRAACDRTTPGRWAVGQPHASWLVFAAEADKGDGGLTHDPCFAGTAPIIAHCNGEDPANAEFIVLAHRLMPCLLAEIKRLQYDAIVPGAFVAFMLDSTQYRGKVTEKRRGVHSDWLKVDVQDHSGSSRVFSVAPGQILRVWNPGEESGDEQEQ